MQANSQFARMSATQQQAILDDLNTAAAQYSDPELTAKTLTVLNALLDYQRITRQPSRWARLGRWAKSLASSSSR